MSAAYDEAVLDFRRRKDEHFAAGRGPVRPETFTGLTYYPPDEAWAFRVPLHPAPDGGAPFTLDTNTGQPRTMSALGTVTLPLPGGERTLTVYAPLGEERPQRVFIPFRDATSGEETYGAGRYLDAPLADDGELWVDVDFNMAYHPYCAYGDGWTCPLPPASNRLPDAVRAGERLAPPSAP
ncbi:hypothetical protein HNQ07_003182 [Deinococcus metalli]|uniref:DUF1684 domain-containing protein n=1 Tax=Deinococcus metalli TaxID=1141878 RepID=A0A7W8KH35_9DEIO|nr:hypothetical protein [Deinococcus metalli]GHF52531.1 hypothetical protein GCM10017781_31110 [Deinococcus metalli]